MKIQYKSSRIKIHKITPKKLMGGSLKRLRTLLSYFYIWRQK